MRVSAVFATSRCSTRWRKPNYRSQRIAGKSGGNCSPRTPPPASWCLSRTRSSIASKPATNASQYASKDVAFWEHAQNRREYMLWLQAELALPSLVSLIKLTHSKIQNYGGKTLLNHYSRCWITAVSDTFPELSWRLDVQKPSPPPLIAQQNYWKGLLRHLNLPESLDGLYTVTYRAVVSSGGLPILFLPGNDRMVAKSIMSAFPDHHWDPSLFVAGAPAALWNDKTTKRRFLDRIGKEKFGAESLSSWYRVSGREFRRKGGPNAEGVLAFHNGDLAELLRSVYEDHTWIPWLFSQVPAGFWDDSKNVSAYFDWLGKRLGIASVEDWYRVSKADVVSNAGGGLLRRKFGDSVVLACQQIFPKHEWLPWRFKHVPQRWWALPENQRKFLDWCYTQLNMKKMDDWRHVSIQQVVDLGGEALIKNQHNGSLRRALESTYPDHQWSWI
eukprot:TRINITY_DN3283_c0_g1_i2.p1 TRINITY_DN3283_c0_g1~~TRINITY_DN3283_c0_g1_i2.p1  ORF type:complete len:444 (+),score=28.05 TRINITY_DN3283_c0_g1_i2:74-1405(+)